MRQSSEDIKYTEDEALEVLIESALQWRKEVRRLRGQGSVHADQYSRSAWLSHFVGWLSDREGPL